MNLPVMGTSRVVEWGVMILVIMIAFVGIYLIAQWVLDDSSKEQQNTEQGQEALMQADEKIPGAWGKGQ